MTDPTSAPSAAPNSPAPPRARISWGTIAFLGLLMAAGFGLIGWTVARQFRPASSGPQVLRQDKPVPSDLARQAKDYLRERNVAPLSGPLAKLLAGSKDSLVRTQLHPLLNEPAPEFALSDHRGKTWKLTELRRRGPVVVIFYYGYHCNHCVSQLFDVNQDVAYFREVGATVVAISADSTETTQKRFKEYGEFAFPVLSDPAYKVATAYGVYKPAEGKKEEVLLHGTFIVDRDGIVQWAAMGDEPFSGNRTLLHRIAELEGRLPARE